MDKLWRTWKYTLGSFMMTRHNLMMIRLLSYAPIFVSYMSLTFYHIWSIRHWHDVPSQLHETQEKGYAKQKQLSKIEDVVFWEEHVKKNLSSRHSITVH